MQYKPPAGSNHSKIQSILPHFQEKILAARNKAALQAFCCVPAPALAAVSAQ